MPYMSYRALMVSLWTIFYELFIKLKQFLTHIDTDFPPPILPSSRPLYPRFPPPFPPLPAPPPPLPAPSIPVPPPPVHPLYYKLRQSYIFSVKKGAYRIPGSA